MQEKSPLRSDEFGTRDQVTVFNHRSPMYPGPKSTRWSGPFTVVRDLDSESVELYSESSCCTLHAFKHRLRPYKGPHPSFTDPHPPTKMSELPRTHPLKDITTLMPESGGVPDAPILGHKTSLE